MINWDVIQVEPKGEFQIKPLCILDKKVTMLWNRTIGQVKVQWEHYSPKEAMWELEDSMCWHIHFCSILWNNEAIPMYHFVQFCKALRIVLLKGEGNVTPRF